jgi:hypothetical protein
MRRIAAGALVVAALLALAGPAAGGGQAPAQPGRYAGGSDRFQIFFDVTQARTIPFARVFSHDLAECGAPSGPAVFDSDTIDAEGRFTLRDDSTHAGQKFKITGRFVRKDKVRGKVRWMTTDNCPAGTYDFEYRADRYAPVG